MDKEKTCILCDKELIEEDTVTVTRGLDTIRKSSIKQGDKMRKNKKSVMYDILESLAGSQDTYPEESKVILDGGYLLRRVIWPQHTTYSDVYSTYVTFV